MYGDMVDGNWFFGLIKDEMFIDDMCDMLIFGLVYQGGVVLDLFLVVVVLLFDVEICGCNGVCKG